MKKITTIILISIITVFNLSNFCYAQYTDLFNFTGTATGTGPSGDLFSDGTFLYGMTVVGGTKDSGTVFKIKPDGTGFAKLLDFMGAINGAYACGFFISDGTFLYGMTKFGGTNNKGTIFKIKPDGTGFAQLHSFAGAPNDGAKPSSSLFYDGTFLYGMTNNGHFGGGSGDGGIIFKIKPDGTGYAGLYNFGSNATDGTSPSGSLISDGTYLYGTTFSGGANSSTNSYGTIFKIKPDGTGYAKFYDFGNSSGDGSKPCGSLFSIGTFLYGMTYAGGTGGYGDGTIFKIKSDGTSYLKLHDFTGTIGQNPSGSFISVGSYLYGMTYGGGAHVGGILFKIKPDGTGFSDLYDFSSSSGTGYNPGGSLISDGTFLYGVTTVGGSGSMGAIFKYGVGTTGIAENIETISFNVYPNPCNGTFTIATKENDYMLIITNVLGENVYQAEIKNPKIEIDISRQPKGIYFLQIIDENKNVVNKKIVVQ